ncbi:MAG: prolipoprotein diacylglyceryl transferase [Acidimicrobiales bacterium]
MAVISYDPLLRIHLGPLSVSPHGIMIAVGVLVGARLALPAAARRGITIDQFYDVLTWALFGALIGARVAYVGNHLGDYLDDPLGMLRVWEGGFSLLGGLAGSVAAGYPKLRSYQIPFWRFMDAVVPGVMLGIAVGRTGDLIIADHLGKPTDFVLGYVCPPGPTGSPCMAPVGQAVHQTALYDMIGAAAVFVLLVWLARWRRPETFLTLVFGVAYGLVRVVEGFSRLDVTHGTGLNGSQWTSIVVVVAATAGLVSLRRRQPLQQPEAPDHRGGRDEPGGSDEPGGGDGPGRDDSGGRHDPDNQDALGRQDEPKLAEEPPGVELSRSRSEGPSTGELSRSRSEGPSTDELAPTRPGATASDGEP